MRASQLFTLSWNCKFFSFYRLHHPNIVELLEVHEDKTKVYLVMELWVNNNNNKQTNLIKKTNWVFGFFYNFRTKLKNGDDVLLPQLHRKCCLHFWHISVFLSCAEIFILKPLPPTNNFKSPQRPCFFSFEISLSFELSTFSPLYF